MKKIGKRSVAINKNLAELKMFWRNFNTPLYYKYLLAIQKIES